MGSLMPFEFLVSFVYEQLGQHLDAAPFAQSLRYQLERLVGTVLLYWGMGTMKIKCLDSLYRVEKLNYARQNLVIFSVFELKYQLAHLAASAVESIMAVLVHTQMNT